MEGENRGDVGGIDLDELLVAIADGVEEGVF